MSKKKGKVKSLHICGWCKGPITVMIFRGSGYCCEDHRKLMVGETSASLESRTIG